MRNSPSHNEAEPAQEKTVLENILAGKAKITHGEPREGFLQEREVFGRNWPGRTFCYDLEVPKPGKPTEIWKTELRIWDPLPLKYDREPPTTQLYILTGHGEMPFSRDPDVTLKVFQEILRQAR